MAKPKKRLDMPDEAALSAIEQKFIESVALGNSYTQAARDAGLEVANVNYVRLLSKPAVQLAIKEQHLLNARALDIKREDVLAGMKEAIDIAKLKEEPMSMIAGWREMAKICGWYETKVQVNVLQASEEKLLEVIDQLDETQLIALANREMETIDGDYTVDEGTD